jgi:hypothetical protein
VHACTKGRAKGGKGNSIYFLLHSLSFLKEGKIAAFLLTGLDVYF